MLTPSELELFILEILHQKPRKFGYILNRVKQMGNMNWILSTDLAIKQMKFKNWIKEREGMLEIDYKSIHDFELNELLKIIESRSTRSTSSEIKRKQRNSRFALWWLTFSKSERIAILTLITTIVLAVIGWIL